MKAKHQIKGYVEGGFRFFFLNDRGHQQIDYHYHTFHKCVIVYEGHVAYTVEGETYILEKGDVLWVPSYEAHKVEVFGDRRYKRLVVYISESFAESLGNGLAARLKKVGQTYEHQNHCDTGSLFPGSMAGEEELIRLGAFIPWMGRSIKGLKRMDKTDNLSNKSDVDVPEWVKETVTYIKANSELPMTVAELAERCYLNQHYFMHRFKEATGTGVHQFIIQERLKVARGLMKQGMKLTDVAYDSGFNNYTTFTRAFKKVYSMSPRNFLAMDPTAQGQLNE